MSGPGIGSREKTAKDGTLYWVYGAGSRTEPTLELPFASRERLAPPEILDRVYRDWIGRLPLSVAHRDNLLDRGFTAEEIQRRAFASHPSPTSEKRPAIARDLVELHGAKACAGVPGLYAEDRGKGAWWTLAGAPGLIVPIRDPKGCIVGLLIRTDDAADCPKYLWVSSKSHDGPSPGRLVHVPLFEGDRRRVRLTEGGLKADLATHLSGLLTIGLPGVGCFQQAIEILRQLGTEEVLLAFDADCRNNPHVAKSLQTTHSGLVAAGFTVGIELWSPTSKGIDDLLLSRGSPEETWGEAARLTIGGIVQSAIEEWRKRDPLAQARAEIDVMLATVREDRTAAFQPSALQALALLRRGDPAAWGSAKSELQGHRISVRDVERALPQLPAQPGLGALESEESRRATTVGDSLPDAPLPSLIMPAGYYLQPDRTGLRTQDVNDAPIALTVALAPVIVVGRLKDADDGLESLRLAWRRPPGIWQHATAHRGSVLNASKVVDLASTGFPASSANSREVVRYLERFEAVNYEEIPSATVSAHLGWQGRSGELGFLWGRKLFSPSGTELLSVNLDELPTAKWRDAPVSFRGRASGDEQICDGYHAAGDPDRYLDAIHRIINYPRVLLAFYCSFVPPLLEIIRAPNFTTEWSNRTSTGKTVTLRVAASVWGLPDEMAPNGVMWPWDATRVGAERLCGILSGLPVILDDTKRIRNKAQVAEVLYAVANGRGRVRGNPQGLSRTLVWRTVLFSSGETPSTGLTQDGGTRPRCLEVRGIPFGRADQETRRLVDSVNLSLLSNYGHAGPAFVLWLMQNRARWEEFAREYQLGVQAWASHAANEVAGRMAQCAAAIDLAAGLAHAALGLPWAYRDPLESLWADIVAEAGDAAGDVRALRDAVSWAYSHDNSFVGRLGTERDGAPKVPLQGLAGRWDSEGWEWIAFFEHRLTSILREQGYEPNAIYEGWKERGWLECDAGRYTRKVSLPAYAGESERPRMLVIKRSAIDEIEA